MKTESTVTVALVKRVSERLAKGIPLELALAGEPVTQAQYEKQLRDSREFTALQNLARREFLEDALDTLLNGKNAGANIRWWLETFFPEIFAKPEPEEVPVKKPTILGWTEEEVERLREAARNIPPVDYASRGRDDDDASRTVPRA